MTTTKPGKRRTERGVQSQPKGCTQVGGRGPRQLGAVNTTVEPMEVTVEMGSEGLHADGVRYGPRGFVALEVVGVPVRRRPAIDDELSWLWGREARLEAVRSELAAARQWGLWELLCRRLDRVYSRSNELWRRWREGAGQVAGGVCKSLVVVGGQVVLRRSEQLKMGDLVKVPHLKGWRACLEAAGPQNGFCCGIEKAESGTQLFLSPGWVLDVIEGRGA